MKNLLGDEETCVGVGALNHSDLTISLLFLGVGLLLQKSRNKLA